MRLTMPRVLLPLICTRSFGKIVSSSSRHFACVSRKTTTRDMVSFIDFYFYFLANSVSRPKLRPICSLYLLMLFETRTWHKYYAWVTCAQICLTLPKRQEKWVLAFAAINYGIVWVTTKKKGRVLVWHARNHFTIINQLWELAFSSLGE